MGDRVSGTKITYAIVMNAPTVFPSPPPEKRVSGFISRARIKQGDNNFTTGRAFATFSSRPGDNHEDH